MAALLDSSLQLPHQLSRGASRQNEPKHNAALTLLTLDARDRIPSGDLDMGFGSINGSSRDEGCWNHDRLYQGGSILIKEASPQTPSVQCAHPLSPLPSVGRLTIVH